MHVQQMLSTHPELCMDASTATGTIVSRRTRSNEELIRQMLSACKAACRLCGEQCERHAEGDAVT